MDGISFNKELENCDLTGPAVVSAPPPVTRGLGHGVWKKAPVWEQALGVPMRTLWKIRLSLEAIAGSL